MPAGTDHVDVPKTDRAHWRERSAARANGGGTAVAGFNAAEAGSPRSMIER
jgi:hypothetical protein